MTGELKTSVKVPPQSKDAEMIVLGCMLNSLNALNVAADRLNESDFYYNEHRLIFSTLQKLYLQDRSVDIHIVAEELKKEGKLSLVGGASTLTGLAQYAGTSPHIEEYCEFVLHKSILRRMILAAQLVEKEALDEPDDVHGALDEAQQKFFAIGQVANAHQGTLISEVLTGVKARSQLPFLKELQERQEKFLTLGPDEHKITGIPTHFQELDKLLNGLEKSNLIILAGRPAMGKTALGINIAEQVCFKSRVPVGIFSLEMSADQIVNRIICSQAGVESEKVKTGSLTGGEYQRIVSTVNEIQELPLIIDDQPGLKVTDLRARARRMKETHDIGFLLIDYLQLLTGSNQSRFQESRQAEISEISRMLKNLARELDIPILCLSQLSRRVDERPGHRPVMSDLRESGSIEQDADQVLFILRRDYYNEMDKPGMAEVIIGKNRHGAVGNVELQFRKKVARFENYNPGEMLSPSHIE